MLSLTKLNLRIQGKKGGREGEGFKPAFYAMPPTCLGRAAAALMLSPTHNLSQALIAGLPAIRSAAYESRALHPRWLLNISYKGLFLRRDLVPCDEASFKPYMKTQTRTILRSSLKIS